MNLKKDTRSIENKILDQLIFEMFNWVTEDTEKGIFKYFYKSKGQF